MRINQVLATKQPQLAYACSDIAMLPDIAGWAVYDQPSEFARIGFQTPTPSSTLSGFRVTSINSNYKLSPTYPSSFVVPAAVSDAELRKIAHFRARGRVPAVTYRHRNDAVIARCAQPLVGLRRKRCSSDEAYMTALRRASTGRLLVVDCRSQTSAYGNIALGGGFEVLDYYREANILFMGIENIHAMRDSIRKLFDLIKHEVRGHERSNWWSSLESTRWLEHVRSVLVSCSVCVSKLTDEATSLLVHCSDGWDRTAQLVALTKLCVDPFYRTLTGFQVLIEQEWCAFGHQFRARSGHTVDHASYWDDEHASPVFMQFVDAVWQLMRQFPCSFEFNERYLIALLDEVYSKRSGTFLHDCEEARVGSMTLTRCLSAWTVLDAHPHASDFRNSFYIVPFDSQSAPDRSPVVLQFKWHTSSLAIWTAFYLRAMESSDSRDAWAKELQVTQRELQDQLSSAHEQLASQAEANSELVSELETLRRESARLRTMVQSQGYRDVDGATNMLVHEQDDDDDDGVLLSVTPVAATTTADTTTKTRAWPFSKASSLVAAAGGVMNSRNGVPPAPPSGLDTHQNGYNLSSGGFVGASISSGFEIFHSYFDATAAGNGTNSSAHGTGASSSAASHAAASSAGGCNGPAAFARQASQHRVARVKEVAQ